MAMFKVLAEYGCESLTFINNPEARLNALIAIHSTKRGPAYGGIRTLSYRSQSAAVTDALRLAQAMSYKAAVADLPAGGGKAVVIKTDGRHREVAFRALGREIEKLGGNFYTGMDVGTSYQDLEHVAKETRHIAVHLEFGKATARGVAAAIRAACNALDGSIELEGRRIAVQGLGQVGAELLTILSAEGATLLIADADASKAEEVGARMKCEVVNASRLLTVECDVLAPCALGSIFSVQSVKQLRCKVIAGSANNQLAGPDAGQAMQKAGIIYVPDYVANSGALIKGVTEHQKGEEVAFDVVDRIFEITSMVLQRAKDEDQPTAATADKIARERLA